MIIVSEISEKPGMKRYEFLVHNSDGVLRTPVSLEMKDITSVWDHIGELSNVYNRPGSRIAVKDETGSVIISVGVVSARKMKESPARI